MLSDLFDPVHERLADLEAGSMTSQRAQPVTSHRRTGWIRVDEEIAELRRHFQAATTPQDYRNIGNDCVIVLERLSEVAYVAHGISGQVKTNRPSPTQRTGSSVSSRRI